MYLQDLAMFVGVYLKIRHMKGVCSDWRGVRLGQHSHVA